MSFFTDYMFATNVPLSERCKLTICQNVIFASFRRKQLYNHRLRVNSLTLKGLCGSRLSGGRTRSDCQFSRGVRKPVTSEVSRQFFDSRLCKHGFLARFIVRGRLLTILLSYAK